MKSESGDPVEVEVEDEEMETMLRGISRRPEPSDSATDNAYAVLKEDWRDQVTRRRTSHKRRRFLQAVAGVGALGIVALVTNIAGPADWNAELAAGTVTLDSVHYATPGKLPLEKGAVLDVAQTTRIEMDNGAELRLAENTQIEWLAADDLYLKHGSAYVDTHHQSSVLIRTDYGQIRDIGTRFMVTVGPQGAQVAVREGEAQVQAAAGVYSAVASAQAAALVAIDRSGVTQSSETAASSRWDWIHDVSVGYTARTVSEVLAQIGRDIGKPVVYVSRGAQATVAPVVVHGDLTQVRPRQALSLLAKSAGLNYREEESQITIDFNR